MIQHYLEWMYGGGFFSESSAVPVDRRDVPQFEVPRGAIAYRFFSREEALLNGERLAGMDKDHSGWHYFGWQVSAEEVLAMPDESLNILKSNIRGNGIKRLVRTPSGRWFPLDEKDTVGVRP